MNEKIEKAKLWALGGLLFALGCGYVFPELLDDIFDSQRRLWNRANKQITTLTSALEAYKADAGVFPTTEQGLDALIHEPTIEPVPERWKATMKKGITDPWAREYHYRQPGVHNPDGYDLWSLGPDGIESDDDIGNWD